MLTSLQIENIAVIEKAEITFDKGLNVLTGETGAGKSIIIDSINAVLGERTTRELVRTGAPVAKVSALFFGLSHAAEQVLKSLDLEPEEDGSLLIQRSISSDGRSACRINGQTATVSMLRQLGSELINIHGQHDSQSLLSSEKHIGFIDALAQDEALLEEYHGLYAAYVKIRRALNELQMDEEEKLRKIDLLRFQIDELEAANLQIGERETLTQERTRCLNAEKILQSLRLAYDAINGTEETAGASQLLTDAAAGLQDAAHYYGAIESTAQEMLDLSYNLESYADEIRNAFDTLSYDPGDLEQIEERLDLLYKLSRKYGETEEEMLAYLEKARAELDEITFSEERVQKLDEERRETVRKIKALAVTLSNVRRQAGERFARQVEAELSYLDMPHVRFIVHHEQVKPGPNGADEIEFLISANPGEPPRPLAKIASGGELSRIMLAIKNVLSGSDEIGTLIFDEIDTGVSGRAAQKIALKLKQVSAGRQVICVTHLAQIAAQADCHLLIQKTVRDDQTYTQVDALDFEGRKRELARIMGGMDEITPLQLQSAEELLRAAGISE
ncbi:MAG: DNA repair protein RecN [Clostridiales bacterium]|nr:DNA repair protein RecN [Clostridiales bacterium]